MIDAVADHGWLANTIMIMNILQMIVQARWIDESAITTLPCINSEHLELFSTFTLPELCFNMYNKDIRILRKVLNKSFSQEQIYQVNIFNF